MNWHRRLATLLVVLTLAGAPKGAQAQAPSALLSPENMHDRGSDGDGDGDGGGSSSSM
jgi:hypothetical protein